MASEADRKELIDSHLTHADSTLVLEAEWAVKAQVGKMTGSDISSMSRRLAEELDRMERLASRIVRAQGHIRKALSGE